LTDEHDRPGEGSAVPARLDDEADSAARFSARRDAEHSAIAEIAYQALGLHDAFEVAQVCARRVAQTVEARYVIVLLLDDSNVLRVAGLEGPAAGAWAMGAGDPIESGAPLTATTENRPIICHDMLHEVDKGMVDLAGLLGVDSGVAVPIPGPDGARGVLTAARPGVGTFTKGDIGFLGSITALLGSALGRLDIEANLRRAAVHDSMTGLPNRILLGRGPHAPRPRRLQAGQRLLRPRDR
jgi:GAF domain-containing protein